MPLSEATSFAAQLFDGVSAVPRAGRIQVQSDSLCFVDSGGAKQTWPVSALRSVQRVAEEVHLILPGTGHQAEDIRIVVPDSTIEAQLDVAVGAGAASSKIERQRASSRIGLRGWALIALVCVPLAYGLYAVLLPRMHVVISREREAALGEHIYEYLLRDWKLVDDSEAQDLLGRMAVELRDRDSRYELRVEIVDQEGVNAVALPGGRILVFAGLIRAAPTPDAVAGVLAHEISHVEERHGLKQLLRSLGLVHFAGAAVGGGIDGFEIVETIVEASSGLLILEQSRDHEREADRLAVEKLRRAARNALGLAEFLRVIQAMESDLPAGLSWVSTHPLTTERIDEVTRLGQGQGIVEPWISEQEWAETRRRFLTQ